jgi:pyrimidine operon attenuation protein/uracil phosphoribosyltransferase
MAKLRLIDKQIYKNSSRNKIMQNKILNATQIQTKLQRIALQIAEVLPNETEELIIIGIKEAGVLAAKVIFKHLQSCITNPTTLLQASLNKQLPLVVSFDIETNFTGKHICIVDDVSNSGKTLTYALAPILQHQPLSIRTAVLVERKYKKFPVQPDFVGLSLATSPNDFIEVTYNQDGLLGAFVTAAS